MLLINLPAEVDSLNSEISVATNSHEILKNSQNIDMNKMSSLTNYLKFIW